MEETKNSKRVASNINSDLPDILGIDQLLKVFRRPPVSG